ncbi:hypothetical protein PRVXT_001575 [Proteinivorax tanatarense]|uniref:Phage protein n=1 Tax=Proteinivorax tanatarense TaxID=1260629 RepID=A0AAU7VIE6_9FIRM
MNVNSAILNALSDLDVPVSFQTYSGKKQAYITFFTYLDKPELFADDKEKVSGFYVQVDIWSKKDYTSLVETVHKRLKDVGFIKINFYDVYEQDLKIYHKVMRYKIEKEE